MNERKQSNLTNPDIWIRLLYMVVFGVLTTIARLVIVVIAILQFLLVLVTGDDNSNLRNAGQTIAKWTLQAYYFLTFASEDKPFPFDDWPEVDADREPGDDASDDDDIPVLTPSEPGSSRDEGDTKPTGQS